MHPGNESYSLSTEHYEHNPANVTYAFLPLAKLRVFSGPNLQPTYAGFCSMLFSEILINSSLYGSI